MGGILSLVWPPLTFYRAFGHRLALQLQPRQEEGEDRDILLEAIDRFNPHVNFLNRLLQGVPLNRRLMADDEMKRRERAELDRDYNIVSSDDSDREEEDASSLESFSLESCSEDEEEVQVGASSINADYTFSVPNPLTYSRLFDDTRNRCGGSDEEVPVTGVRRKLELGLWNRGGGGSAAVSGMPSRQKTNIVNRMVPNRRRVITAEHTKSFVCQFLEKQQQIAVASQDEEVRFYGRDRKGRYRLERKLQVPFTGWSILDVATSSDGRLMCYSTWADSVYVGRLEGEEALGGWMGKEAPAREGNGWTPIHVPVDTRSHRMAIFSLRFSHDDRELLCGGADDRVHVLDVERERRVLQLKGHEDDVNTVSWGDTDMNIIYTAGDDGLCKVWDRRICPANVSSTPSAAGVDPHQPVGVFAGHRDGIVSIHTRGDDRYICTNSKDQSIKVWDVRRFSSYDGISQTRLAVSRQQWDYRWQTMPTSARNQQLLKGDTSLATLRGHSVLHTLVRARWSPPEKTGARYIYTGCAKGDVVLYDVLEMRPVRRLQGHRAVVRDCLWTPDSNEIFTASWDGVTAVWDWDERQERMRLRASRREQREDGDEANPEDASGRRMRVVRTVDRKRRRRNTSNYDHE